MKHYVKAMLGGFSGTIVMTLMMYFVAPVMTGQSMDIAEKLGTMLGNSWIMGMIAHWVNGVLVFPTIYVSLLVPLLNIHHVLRGMIWGIILWLIAQAMVMPMIGAGFFSANLGVKAVVASLISHIIYGVLLGAIAGAPEKELA